MNAGSQTMEDFWGAALSKSKKELKWTMEEDDDSDSMFSEKSLELRQACLGAGAKEGERNVVELTVDNEDGEEVTHTLLSMRVGGTEQAPLFLTLQPPAKFKLVQGSGPIHIVGQINETVDLSMLDGSDDDEEEEEEEVGSLQKIKENTQMKKRPASSVPKGPSKMAKLMSDNLMDLGNGDKWDDEDSEDDDEEEDDSEEEDEDAEEEESEEEEETVKPPAKKSQNNGNKVKGTPHPNNKKGGTTKTPQPARVAGVKQSRSQSLPGTPKSEKNNKKQGKGSPDLNEIKQRLAKMAVPKKLEKFNNFVSNSFKIKDESVKKQLWEFVQKNRSEK